MTVLTDFSEPAVNTAIESNFIHFLDDVGKMSDAHLYRGDDVIRVMVPSVPHPLMNLVTRTRLYADVDSKIAETMAVYTAQNIPFLWQIEPATQPTNLGEKLAAHGMQPLGNFEVLVVDLDAVTETANPPAGYEIKQVLDDVLLQAFGNVLEVGFQLPRMVVDAMLPILHQTDPQAAVANYVGLLDGEPVSVGTVICAAGVAGFYNGTVLESARGKGVGTANALHRMQAARERGYRIGFMISGGNAYNLYNRLGFKDYPAIQRYLWMPTPDETAG